MTEDQLRAVVARIGRERFLAQRDGSWADMLLAALKEAGLVVVDKRLLLSAADSICGAYCQSTWKTGEPQPHCKLCVEMHAAATGDAP